MASLIALSQIVQFNTAAVAEAPSARLIVNENESVEELIITAAKNNDLDPSLALKIASCESHLQQFGKDGLPLRGEKNPDDVGLFQINERFHLERSRALGFDLETVEGNINYAMTLLKEKDGLRHWQWSKKCWSTS